MKKIILIFILGAISVLFISNMVTTNSTSGDLNASNIYSIKNDDNVINAAKRELNKFLSLIPQGSEKSYGFEKREDFLNAEIGIPYRLYVLRTGLVNVSKIDLEKFILPLDEWRVPILINYKMVSF